MEGLGLPHLLPGFPGGSAGKESACNAGDPDSTPGLGRSPGEGTGSPLQYSWASLVAQLVKSPPARQETEFKPWVGKIPGEGHSNPLQYSCLENSIDREAWRATVRGVTKSGTRLSD